MGKIIEVEITKLKDAYDIRSTMNEDHVIFLWTLIDAGVSLPPIKITEDYSIVDGRHRRAAYQNADFTTIKAEIIKTDGAIDIVREALGANMGGALPPTKLDIYRTMTILVNRGYSKERIIKELKPILPLGLIRSAHHNAIWQINNKKVNETIDLMTTSSLTLEKAAKITGADMKAVKDKLERKKKINPNIEGNLTQMFSHFNMCLGKIVSKLFQDYEDGEETKLKMKGVFERLSKLISNQNRMYFDWNKRWNYKK